MIDIVRSAATAALGLAGIVLAGSANATSYSSPWDGSGLQFEGAPVNIGEVFTAPENTLTSFGLYFRTYGTSVDANLVVADWDGSKAVGPALYASTQFTLNAGSVYLLTEVSGLAVPLTVGHSYVAYFATGNVTPINGTYDFAQTGSGNGGLGGYQASNFDADPLTSLTSWGYASGVDAFYTANFTTTVAPTPIPAALPLFASALSGLAFMGWRRRRGAV